MSAIDVIFSSSSASDVESTGGNLPVVEVEVGGTVSAVTTVDVVVLGGTATGGGVDYSHTATVTIPAATYTAGDTIPTVLLTINTADTIVENDETLQISLQNPSTGQVNLGTTTTHTCTITDDDEYTVTLSGTTPSGAEGANLVFTVNLDQAVPAGQTVTVPYSLNANTAVAADYNDLGTGSVVYTATESGDKTITIEALDDALIENTETFSVALGVVTDTGGHTVNTAGSPQTATITDNDTATFTIDDVSVAEATGTMNFTVSLSNPMDTAVTVYVSYADVTATGSSGGTGADYDNDLDIVIFAAGDNANKNVTVTVTDDAIKETDESFYVNLSTPTAIGGRSADFGDTASGTIINDDYNIFFVADVTVDEGDGVATFEVSLDRTNTSGGPIGFMYSANDLIGVADTANAPSDYTPATNVFITIPDGEVSETFNIPIVEDANVEHDEVFTVQLSSAPGNATITDDVAIGTIENNDVYDITINDDAASEGNLLEFTVSLDQLVITGDSVTVDYTTQNVTTDGSDYTAASGTLTFIAGEDAKILTIVTTEDTIVERNESFEVVLSNPTQATRGTPTLGDDTGVGTITNDDNYEISIQDIAGAEGSTLNFDFGLNSPVLAGDSLTFTVQTADGSATVANSDYTPVSVIGTTLNGPFASASWGVNTTTDTTVERDETFSLTISAASSGLPETDVVILDDTGIGTIQNNDPYDVTVNDVTANEGDDIVFTVSVNPTPLASDGVTVNYTASDNTTSGAADYALATSSVVFNPGDTTKTVTFTTVEDDVVEYDESFNLNINTANTTFPDTGSVIGVNTGIGTIANDDKYKISVDDVSTDEPDGVVPPSGATAAFTITLHQAVLAGQTAEVDFTTSGTPTSGPTGSPIASPGTDYTATSGTKTFNPGDSTQTVNVTVLNESGDRDTEYYYLNVSPGATGNTELTDSTGEGTIVDNDYEVTASVDATNNQGTICRGGASSACDDPIGSPPGGPITEIIERDQNSSPYTITANFGYCISDVQRNGTSVLGGTVPISPYAYTATNIQDDPTTIVASFRSEVNFTTNIEPVEARTYGQWRLRDTSKADLPYYYVLPLGHPKVNAALTTTLGYPATAVADDAWLDHGDTVVIPCDKAGYDLEYKEVSGWFTPATVSYSIPPATGSNFTATGTYVSKTVTLTLATSAGLGTETIDVEPVGSGEAGPNTHTYKLVDNVTVSLTANAAILPAPGSIFLSWTGPVADPFASTTTVLMDQDRTVTANFGLPGVDNDGDGYDAGPDCNDSDPTIHPDAPELCGDGIDQDCTGGDPVCVGPDADDDGDGYTENQGDCDDTNAAINPGATEICGNAIDEDCYDGPRDCGTEVICSDYAERPLETQAAAAAPMVMFVLDDSGSMDWTMMTEEGDGLFDGERYVWNIGDNQYSQVLSASERREWRSQYAAYNKMYYNPATDYVPWPDWNTADDTEGTTGTKIKDGGTAPPIDADQDNPRSNPVRDDWTLDMDATFFSVLPATTVTQWITVERHGGSTGNSTLADAVKLVGTGYAGDPDTFQSDAGTLANNNLIVDNEPDQTDHTFTENGNWNTSGSPNPWDENARYTTGNNSATWRFSVPITGTYDVYARWNEYNQRDENARYAVTYNNGGTTTNYSANQRLNGNSWVQLATGLPFTIQDNSSAGAINVKNAHYFIWVDHDGDGTMEYQAAHGVNATNSEVYLINVPGSAGTYTLNFYRFVDASDNAVVNDGELFLLTAADTYWNDIQPRNEGGTLRTPAEERQNIANWWSFYRRRELTAKAAIGRTISGTEGMHIGIMGINARIEEELVPIGVESTQIKTLDNQDASYSDTGTWSESGSPNEFNGSSFFTSNSGNTARWTPTFTAGEAGTYRVYAWWNCFSNRDSNAKYTVVDKDGSTDYFKDQRSGQTNSQCGQWVQLGVHAFDETGSQYVEVARHAGSTGSSTNADAVRFESTGAKVTVNQTPYILNKLYQVNSSGGTPLRRGLQNAGKYFDNEDSGATGGLNATPPWASAADGGGCQRAFAIVMTDGYYNGSNPSPSVGNEDSDGNRPLGTNADGIGSSTFDSSFYAGTGNNTLSDVAMYYYEKDLHGGLANDVPPVNYDLADHQHMVTYGVSFGVKGTLDPSAYPNCLPDTPPTETTATCPSWPNPNSNARKIDDLYHASVSGRGKYLNAANPGELVSALKEIIEDVADKTGTGSSVSINAQELKEGTLLFQASYLTGSWRGDLAAKTLNAQTGEIESTLWSAAEQLFTKTHDTRKIVTYNGTVGKHFRYDTTTYTSELTDAQIKKLLNLADARDLSVDVLTATEKTALENLVDYLRGDATNEGTSGGTFRQRARKDGTTDIGVLGDIVHSAPLHVGEVVYVGGNDGMLHAFDDTTGEELWAYVPNLIYDDLDELASQSYQHNFYVDNSPFSQVIKDSGGNASTLLTGTLGRGGKGVYALNISSPKPATEADARTLARWEYPSATQPTASPGSDDDLGFGFGRAFIVNSHLDDGASDTRYVVIMGNGYQSANGEAMLYVLDAHTGALLGKIETDVGTPVLCNGLSVPVLIDPDFDGIADFAYAGDLLGNMWKFDLRGDSISDWKVAHNTNADGTSGTPQPMFQAKNKQGHRQPITTKADVMAHPDAKLGGYMVIFGTGRYLGNADFGENSIQTIYGIWDWQPTWEAAGISSPDKYLGAFGPISGTPKFGRLNYINKPAGSDFIIGQTVTGASSTATGVIEEIVEDSVRLDYINKPTATDFVVGQTVTGGTSSATGVIDVIAETDDNSGYLILTNLSATSAFSAGELITSLTVTSSAEVATVAGSSSGSLKLNTLSATAFVIGEAITTATVSSDAVVANEVIPIAFRPLTNIVSHAALAGVGQYVSLLEQNQIAFLQQSRFMSNHPAYWFNPSSSSTGRLEHAGWYFDLPGNNEKMIRDPLIRNGIAFVISSIPSSSPCASGGSSIIHALDGATGGRSLTAVFDISGPEGVPDGKIDEHDLVNIGTPDNPRYVAPTGLMRDAMWYTPAVLAVQDAETDVMYFSTSEGDVQLMKVEAEKTGVYYWREIP